MLREEEEPLIAVPSILLIAKKAPYFVHSSPEKPTKNQLRLKSKVSYYS